MTDLLHPPLMTPLRLEHPPADSQCPVIRHACQALQLGRSLAFALRRLRRSALRCGQCPDRAQCPALSELNQQIHLAVQEISEEWNLHLD